MLDINEKHSKAMITRARRNTLGDLLTRSAAKYPDKLALRIKITMLLMQNWTELLIRLHMD